MPTQMLSAHRPSRLLPLAALLIIAGIACPLLSAGTASPAATAPSKAAAASTPGLYDPVADPKAIVTAGHARFTVLTPQLIRLEWSPDSRFEDHASFVFLNRKLPVPKFTSSVSGSNLTLKTDALTLTYSGVSSGDRFDENNLHISLTLNGAEVAWHPGLADTGNLLGTTRTLDGVQGSQTRDPIEPGLVSRNGWTLVDDSTRPLFDSADFRFTAGEKSPWPWVLSRPEAAGRQDWYFFGYGHDYKQALGDYVRVAGRIPIPPKFALGAWWSRYWAYSDQELNDIVRGFRQNDVPLDVLVIDMDWHPTYGNGQGIFKPDAVGQPLGWTGYSWNKFLFPDPSLFLGKLHSEGVKATLNLHPASGVQPWEDRYPEMARAMGIDPASKKYVPFDITDPKFAHNYLDILHHPLERQGIDFWWLDWQQQTTTNVPGVTPTWWLNYVHFSDQEREGKRPLLFHRWGGLGNHRYQIGFSGDTASTWESLAFQPYFTATAANVGYAWWSHDIGGHQPGAVEPELYTRWVQFGTFSPILRTHTTKNPDSERRIWAYPEPYSDILRDSFHLRYALYPYLYTEARRTYDTGVAFFRPLYYDSPESEDAYTAKNEYIFGENMIVAPVTAPADPATALSSEKIWLPAGDWFEWQTGRRFTGPVQLDRRFSIRQVPVYVRAGSIVPTAPPMLHITDKPLESLILNVFPLKDGQSSSYELYEDSGEARAYQASAFARTRLSASQQASTLSIEIAPPRGTYTGAPTRRGYSVRLPGDWPPQSVTVNGQPIRFQPDSARPGWSYDGATLTTILNIAPQPVSTPLHISVHRSADLVSRRPELDGYAGTLTRLRETYDTLNGIWPIDWSPDILIDAMQSGQRLTYHPDSAASELTHFHAVLPQALQSVREVAKDPDPEQRERLAGFLRTDQKSDAFKKRFADARSRARRAIAQAEDAAETH